MFPKDTEWPGAPRKLHPGMSSVSVGEAAPWGEGGALEAEPVLPGAGKKTDPSSPSPDHWNPGPCSALNCPSLSFPTCPEGCWESEGLQLAHRSGSRSCLWAEGCRQQRPRRQPRSQLAEAGRTLRRGLLSPRRSSIIQTITAPLFKV